MCNHLQKGLPVCPRPFAEMAKSLDSNEKTVLQETLRLKNAGILRRIGPLVNYRALGRTGTLVAAHIPQKNLKSVIKAVNSLEGVSHNYTRKHYYNLWFTLQAKSPQEITTILSDLSQRFGIDFHSLPVKRIFKLDVRFDTCADENVLPQDAEDVPGSKTVKLNKTERLILSKLQNDLKIVSKPFDFLCDDNLTEQKVLKIIQTLIEKGVIRRIAGVFDHRKLGITANAMFAGELPGNRVVAAGRALAGLRIVSHCYERRTFDGWPYNLFAMMHSRSMKQIREAVNKFVKVEKTGPFIILPTAAELKKQPVKYRL